MHQILRFLTICVLYFIVINAKAQVFDNFSDGNFTNNPAWAGMTDFWTVENEQLRSASDVVNHTFYLSTPSTQVNNTIWEFWVNLRFNPSSANYVDVWLIADSANLTTARNGYFVRLGNTRDEVCLYRVSNGAAPVLIIDGEDNVLNTSNNTVRVRVVKTPDNNITLSRDLTGGNNYFTEGTVNDNSVTSGTHFGILVRQSTASFHRRHYFDDINVREIVPDLEPPIFETVAADSARGLTLTFNEPISIATAQNVNNYTVNGGIGNPASATRSSANARQVHLAFANPFIPNQDYAITVSNIADLEGNVMTQPTVKTFRFSPVIVPTFRQVIINEFIPNPNPPVNTLPNAEFVELYNRTPFSVNLSGFTLSDRTATAQIGNLIIPPDTFVILCPNSAVPLFQPFGLTHGISLPSLNNDGDDIILKNSAGEIIDELSYNLTWYQNSAKRGGWSIELINPNLKCSGSGNWRASEDANGGTPGRRNSVLQNLPDITPPRLVAAALADEGEIELTFSEPLDLASITNGEYTVSDGVEAVALLPAGGAPEKFVLALSPPLNQGKIYSLTIKGVSDCEGNVMRDTTISFGKGKTPDFGEMLLTELMPRTARFGSEYVEIFNNTDLLLNPEGCRLADASGSSTLPSFFFLPGEYVILCPTADVAKYTQFGKVIGLSSWPTLNDNGDDMALISPTGRTLHYANYNNNWYATAAKRNGGWSLELIDPSAFCLGQSNWAESEDPSGGTPGRVNSVKASKPDLTPPAVEKIAAEDSIRLLLRLTESIDSVTMSNLAYYEIDGGIDVVGTVIARNNFSTVTLVLSQPLQGGREYTLFLKNLTDCSGNMADGSIGYKFVLPAKPQEGDLKLNEVLADPEVGGVDFVEIVNVSNKFIDLRGIWLGNATDSVELVSEVTVLNPGQYCLLTSNTQLTVRDYPRSRVENFIQMGRLPSYNIANGTVRIINGVDGKTWERFDYDNKFHTRILDRTKGVSLERISLSGPVNDRNNWHSAAEDAGNATPGYLNSQSRTIPDADAELLIEPEVIVPDRTGFNDIATISYRFPSPGFVGNLYIFDDRGRMINQLVRNQVLGTQGFFKWDGTTEEGRKARVGAYLVVFEVFNLSGEKKVIRKPVVVGAMF
jgi:hypothetical protein